MVVYTVDVFQLAVIIVFGSAIILGLAITGIYNTYAAVRNKLGAEKRKP